MGRSSARFGVLGVTSADPVLSLLSALGLGQTAVTALVIDLCRDLNLPGARTLSDLAAEGPALSELSPGRSGVGLLAAGPMTVEEMRPAIEALAVNWPAIVIRCHPGQWAGPVVPVRPLLPGLLQSVEQSPAVWQPLASGSRPTGPGPVLPRLRGSLARRMLSGASAHRARWVTAWAPIWGMPWA
ncbi:MAG TPA: hypothetical protein VLA91_15435 [Acidimicrobiia bacterium]|nr:hypothetical protein [Acidimicrobiia bacterium]